MAIILMKMVTWTVSVFASIHIALYALFRVNVNEDSQTNRTIDATQLGLADTSGTISEINKLIFIRRIKH